MSGVAFDTLGAGQKGRLVYQVIGKSGPIMNPRNIRYLSPNSPEIANIASSTTGPISNAGLDLVVGLSAANLMCSIGTLAISAHTAFQISALHRKIDALQIQANRIEGKIDHIIEIVERIDTKVSENNLRHALNYVLHKAVSIEGVDLQILANLNSDLETFIDSLPQSLMFNFGVHLSSDIRDQLQLVCGLLHCTRKLVVEKHNNFVKGDPESSVVCKPRRDYFYNEGLSDIVKDAILHDSTWRSIVKTIKIVGKDIDKRFWFVSDEDVNHYQELMQEKLCEPLDDSFLENNKVYGLLASMKLPSKVFENQDYDEKFNEIYDICLAWLYNSDAGLLHRTLVELTALETGYEHTMWHYLSGNETNFSKIDVACELPIIEVVSANY